MNLKSISNEEIKNGILKAINNSDSLIQDGKLLYANHRYPRAFTMFQFASEELGKAVILFYVLIMRKMTRTIDYSRIANELTNHSTKFRYSVGIELTAVSIVDPSQLSDKKNILKNTYKKLRSFKKYNDLKNGSLYISIKNDKIVEPAEIISKNIVKEIMSDVDFRFQIYAIDIVERLGSIDEIAQKLTEYEHDSNYLNDLLKELDGII